MTMLSAQYSNPIDITDNNLDINPNIINIFTGKPINHEPEPPKREYYTKESAKQPVQAFKTREEVQQAKEYFLSRPERYKHTNIRDYTIFVLGINLARRAGDLLHLRWHNVLDEDYSIKTHLCINEQKTSKPAIIIINNQCQQALTEYMDTLFDNRCDIDLSEYIFPSRRKDSNGSYKAMSVKNFYMKLQDLKKELNIKDPIGTHSMRKTSGYQILRDGDNAKNPAIIAQISNIYGHNNIETTFHYLGIEQEEKDVLMLKYEF